MGNKETSEGGMLHAGLAEKDKTGLYFKQGGIYLVRIETMYPYTENNRPPGKSSN
jgi:hypothetical protein